MSRTIDQKVIEMEFDNDKFEHGVEESMGTIERLKKSLDFSDSAKGLNKLNDAGNSVDFGGLGGAIELIQDRLSVMGIVGMTVLKNLTEYAMNAAGKLANTVFGTLFNGGKTRAMNIEQAKFQLQGLGIAWNEIAGDIDYGVKDTAYSLDAAALIASQLAASGVEIGNTVKTIDLEGVSTDLDRMAISLRGVSGVAAMTNSEYADIGRIFATVAGNGRLMGDQLLQLGSRGLNVAAAMADFFNDANDGLGDITDSVRSTIYTITGGIHVTEKDIRELTSAGKINFEIFAEAMDNAFGQHAKDANNTLTGVLANIRAALSKIGADVWTPMVRNYGPLVEMFEQLRLKINAVRTAIHEALGWKMLDDGVEYLTVWKDYTDQIFSNLRDTIQALNIDHIKEGTITVIETIKDLFSIVGNIFTIVKNLISPIMRAFNEARDMSFLQFGLHIIKDISGFLNNIISKVTELTSVSESTEGIFYGIFRIFGFFADMVRNLFSFITPIIEHIIWPLLNFFTPIISAIIEGIGKIITMGTRGLQWFTGMKDAAEKWSNWLKPIGDKITEISNKIATLIRNGLGKIVDQIVKIKNVGITEWFNDILTRLKESSKFGATIAGWIEDIVKFFGKIKEKLAPIINDIKEFFIFLDNYSWERFKKDMQNMSPAAAELVGKIDELKIKFEELYEKVKNSKFVQDIRELFTRSSDEVKSSKFVDIIISVLNAFIDLGTTIYHVLQPVFTNLWNIIKMVWNDLSGFIHDVFSGINVDTLIEGGIAGALIILTKKIKEAVDGFTGFKTGILNILKEIKNVFVEWQTSIKADTIKKIAVSIAILTASLVAMSFLDEDALIRGISIITLAMAGLVFALKQLLPAVSDAVTNFKEYIQNVLGKAIERAVNFTSIASGLLMIAGAILIVAKAANMLGKMDSKEVERGIIAVGSLIIALGAFNIVVSRFTKDPQGFNRIAVSTIEISVAMLILSQAVKKLGKLDIGALAKGLSGIGILLGELLLFSKLVNKKDMSMLNTNLLYFSGAIAILSIVAHTFLLVPWKSLGKLALVMGGFATAVGILTRLFVDRGQDFIKLNSTLAVFAASMEILAIAARTMSGASYTGILATAGLMAEAFTLLGGILVGIPVLIAKGGLQHTLELVGKTLYYIGFSAGLAGAGVLAFALAIKVLADTADDIPTVLAAIGQGIVLFLDNIKGTLHGLIFVVVDFILGVIDSVFEALKNRIGNMLESLATIVVEAAVVINQYAPELINIIIDLLIKVLDGVGSRIEEIVDAVVDLLDGLFSALHSRLGGLNLFDGLALNAFIASCGLLIFGLAQLKEAAKDAVGPAVMILMITGLMAAILGVISNLDPEKSLPNTVALVMLLVSVGAILGVFSELKISSAAAMEGAKAFISGAAILVGGIVAIAGIVEAVMGLLAQLPNSTQYMQDGIDLLTVMLSGLGSAFGSLIGSFIDASLSTLPNIGTYLTQFMENASGFFDIIEKFSGSGNMVSTAESLANTVMTLINATSAVQYQSDPNANFETVSQELVDFADTIKDFSDSVSELDDDDIAKTETATNIAKGMADFASEIPRQGGFWQDIAGTQDIADFGEKIKTFIGSIISSTLLLRLFNLNEDDATLFDRAKKIGENMNSLAAQIPKLGLLQAIVGMQDLGLYGTSIGSYIQTMKTSSDALDEMKISDDTEEKFRHAVNIGSMMLELMKSIPVVNIFSIGSASADAAAYGDKIRTYIQKVCDILDDVSKSESLTDTNFALLDGAIEAGYKIVDFVKYIPDDISNGETFKTGIEAMGDGLDQFADTISKIETEKLEASVEGIQGIVDLLIGLSGTDLTAIATFSDAIFGLSSLVSGSFAEGFELGIPDISTEMNTIMTDILSIYSQLPQIFTDITMEACGQIILVLDSNSQNVIDAGARLGISLRDGLYTVGAAIVKIPQEVVFEMNEKLQSTEVLNAFGSTCSSLADYASEQIDKYDDFYESGKNVMKGFINGMVSLAMDIAQAAYTMGRTAINNLNLATQVASPSKLAMKSGVFFGQGYVNGITSMISDVSSSSGSLGKSALDALSMVVSRVGDMIDSDMDFSPTITPVMDLSEIQNGIGTMNGYLLNGNYQIGGVSANLARNLGNNGMQTQLSAISELAKELSNIDREPTNYNYTQINNSPKYLSRLDIYRNTKNLLSLRQKG